MLYDVDSLGILDGEAHRAVLDNVSARTGDMMSRFREQVDETVHAGVQVGSQVLIFDSRPSSRSDGIGSRMGQLRPAYCTSAGKLLLSRLSMKQLSVLFPEEQFLQYTPFTLATRTALFAELSRTAELDYAVICRNLNSASAVSR